MVNEIGILMFLTLMLLFIYLISELIEKLKKPKNDFRPEKWRWKDEW